MSFFIRVIQLFIFCVCEVSKLTQETGSFVPVAACGAIVWYSN